MPISTIHNAFLGGELSPSVWGRTDIDKYHLGAFTLRNFFVNYKGGASSRSGTAYVGTCKQLGTAAPPRDINFQFNINQGFALEFGDQYMRVKSQGAYVVEANNPITAITKANPGVFTYTNTNYSLSNGDWIFISGVGGMKEFNGLTWIVAGLSGANFHVTDLFGNAVDTTLFTTYTSGGTLARIYTAVAPYSAVDLPYLKYTQSQNTMSLTCVNTESNTEYPPYDLLRVTNTNWSFTAVDFATSIAAPTNVTVTAEASTTLSTYYSYVVTAIDSMTGEESVASNAGSVQNNDIAVNAGSNTISWSPVTGASSYNIYKATPSYNAPVHIGVAYGYLGDAFGTNFTDTNITADFTHVPPTHQNPFARGQITDVIVTAPGSGYTQATVGFSITTSTGSGFAGSPIVSSTGTFVGFIIENDGKGYLPGDTITITDSGGGTGATAMLTIGPQTGTYPGSVAYFQQRRVYAETINNPNTYYMSQPGAFLNMDSSVPAIASDAIVGSPWAQQVNGIQFLVPMPGGLVVYTGNGAWQLNGGTQSAITPSDQSATPQSQQFGCSPFVQPIPIGYNILFLDSQGSITRNMQYNYYFQIYETTDQTVLSSHLFLDHQLIQWAYCDAPYKIIWAVRDDGILLSLTYLTEQKVSGWARHDTNGIYQCVCKVKEPPVDALYLIVKRYVRGQWLYYSERMNDRNWVTVEDSYCVDSGLQWPMTFPNATLNASTANVGTATFTASSSVFSSGNVGQIIRMGGGKATVTAYVNGTTLTATITQAITSTIPDDPDNGVVPQISGNWSITPITNVVSGINHLEGKLVSILADGSVMPPQIVLNGAVSLPQSYSAITIGLPYTCQLQTPYLDPPGPTIQGKRKNIYNTSIRVESSRGFSTGTNQVDSSTQPNNAIQKWPLATSTTSGMVEVKERGATVYLGASIPLFTGDIYQNVFGSWDVHGQVAVQQTYPLPCNILSVVTYYATGDSPGD